MSASEWFKGFFDQAYLDLLAAQMPPARTRREVDGVVRLLGLAPGASILDVPCGFGRHSHELARRGFTVEGVDLSRAMIAEARRRLRPGLRLCLRRGDMRRLEYDGNFDALICMYNGFGYFSRREDLATLKRMARALKPGGSILFDHRDAVYDARHGSGREWYRVGRGLYVLEDRSYEPATRRLSLSWLMLKPGDKRVRRKCARLSEYTLAEWRRLFAAAGLELTAAYAGLDGRPYRAGAGPRLVVVGRRQRRASSAG